MYRKILNIITPVILVTVGVVVYMDHSRQRVVRYIDSREIFDKFEMKKKYETDLQKSGTARKQVIDSLQLKFNLLGERLKMQRNPAPREIEEYKMMERELYYKQKAIEEDNQNQVNQYDQQIWTQLNQYIADYGKQQGIDLLIGAKGDGNVMYGSDAMNVTGEVLTYCNNRYHGANK